MNPAPFLQPGRFRSDVLWEVTIGTRPQLTKKKGAGGFLYHSVELGIASGSEPGA